MGKKNSFEFLRKIDIFSLPVNLTLNQEKKISTPFGGIISSLVFIAFIAVLTDQIFIILAASFTESSTTYSAVSKDHYAYNVSN